MADAFILNQTPATYSATIFSMITFWTGAGWVGKASGDGSSGFSSTTNIFTGSGAGANKTGNASGWIRLQDPGGIREFYIQWDNSGGIRMKYSPVAKFTGGSPSATQVPTATDEQFICGAGTPASPLYKNSALPTGFSTGTNRMQGGARGTSPYGWWIAAGQTGGTTTNFAITFDPVTGDSADVDQRVWYTSNTTAFAPASFSVVTVLTQNSNTISAFMDTGLTLWEAVGPCRYNLNSVFMDVGGAAGVNPFSPSKIDLKPILYERNSAQTGTNGQKGYSNNFRWVGTNKTNFIDTADTKNWICLDGVWAFWDGTTTPVQ